LIYYYYGLWRYSGPKDIGRATTAALRFWNGQLMSQTKFNNQIVRIANWDSLANGFLMRISTFITYYYYTHIETIYETINNYFNQTEQLDDFPDSIINLYHDIYIESYKNVEVTHPNYENGISSAVFTLMTFVGMIFKDAKKVFSIFEKISKSQKFIECHKDNSVKSSAKFVQQKYAQMISDIINGNQIYVYSQMGYYIHGFKLCIYFLHKYPDMAENKNIDIYYDIMCEICDFGGDTDTNCAIVGAMIGPIIGYKNFKIELFERFIRFVPYNRCQFTTAFMYIYVK
jgi:ADP-ribosylglycohydrolase